MSLILLCMIRLRCEFRLFLRCTAYFSRAAVSYQGNWITSHASEAHRWLPHHVSTYLSNQGMLWGTSFLRWFLFGNKVIKHFFLVLFPIGNTMRKHVSHYISYLFKCIPMPREQLNQKAGNAPEFWCKQMASESELLLSSLTLFFPKIVEKFWCKMKTELLVGKPPQSLTPLFWQKTAS